ncbi:MAG: site-2 protease family protein [Gammaproteobacteria bacterium]
MNELNTIQNLAVWALPVILAITVHEVAHGRVALQCGDTTAFTQGRLSLNPLHHIDPIGTVLVPAVLFFLGGFVFGWAKPVPVNYHQLRHPKRDMALVALAGPAANLIMATVWALLFGLGLQLADTWPWVGKPLVYMGYAGIMVNSVLAVLNMLPVPPLDGSRVLAGLLPNGYGRWLARIEPYGLLILVVLMASDWLGKILGPPVFWLSHAFISPFLA